MTSKARNYAFSRTFVGLGAAVLALAAAGCAGKTAAFDEVDLRNRSAITLKSDQRSLALFARGTSGILDGAQERKIQQFVQAYRAEGRGPMHVRVPQRADGKTPRPAGLLAALGRHGVSGSSVKVSGYVAPQGLEPAVQLAYETVGAVATCRDFQAGTFERDPGAAGLGCAYTAAIARTVADPLDLAEPRRTDLSPSRGPSAARLAVRENPSQ